LDLESLASQEYWVEDILIPGKRVLSILFIIM
jgi:hypothetical protein